MESHRPAVEERGAWDPDRARDALAEAGLGAGVCCVMPPGRDLAIADSEVVARTQDYLHHCVEVADRLGAEVVAGPMYAAVGRLWLMDEPGRRAAISRVAEGLRPVAEHAGECGVTLAIEP